MRWRLASQLLLLASFVIASSYGEEETKSSSSKDPALNEKMLKIIEILSPECQKELSKVHDDPESISDACRQELSKAAKKIVGTQADGESSGESETKTPASQKKRDQKTKKKKKKKDSSAISIVLGFVMAAVVGLIGSCVFINRRIHEAGLYQTSQKKLSKRKTEKKRRQNASKEH